MREIVLIALAIVVCLFVVFVLLAWVFFAATVCSGIWRNRMIDKRKEKRRKVRDGY